MYTYEFVDSKTIRVTFANGISYRTCWDGRQIKTLCEQPMVNINRLQRVWESEYVICERIASENLRR